MKCRGGVLDYLSRHELGICSLLAGACFIAFMTLLPLLIDPSIVTFVLSLEPAMCLTQYSAQLNGTSNCTWTSCQQGCTVDIYKCWHINVSYSLNSSRRASAPAAAAGGAGEPAGGTVDVAYLARLYPNVVGCGYPPVVHCDQFYRTYGRMKAERFACFVSSSDPSVAVIHVDFQEAAVNLSLGFVPLLAVVAVFVYISWRLRCKRRHKMAESVRQALEEAAQMKLRIEESKRLLARRKQSWSNAFRLDRISASSLSASQSSLDVEPHEDTTGRNFLFRPRGGGDGVGGVGGGGGDGVGGGGKKRVAAAAAVVAAAPTPIRSHPLSAVAPIPSISALIVSPNPLPRVIVNN